ncbi:MAG: biotin-dependent carboxyltransferase family protein [Acidobacteriota bacterium]
MNSGIRVIAPGFLSTVQDLGRHGLAHLGVSPAGAADSTALRLGNLLVGNSANAPAVEMTLLGGTFEFEADSVIAITGADFGPTVDGQAVPAWTSLLVRRGQRIQLGPTRAGARAYLCIRGGIRVPLVLGSASTHLQTRLGGHDGRALRKGDMIELGDPPGSREFRPVRLRPSLIPGASGPLRATRGPQWEQFTKVADELFFSSAFKVLEDSNRVGLRLGGPTLERRAQGDMLTEGVSAGAVQVPDNRQPILLFVERPTTGGYPKIANVISADLSRVGQLRPRDEVRFAQVSIAEAVELLRAQEALIGPDALEPAG